jgi:MioC protein
VSLELTILIGTMTGTAQLVAQEVELTLDGEEDLRVISKPMDGMDGTAFKGGGLFLICTSTYGQGDVPDNARPVYEALQSTRPDLSDVRYGVIALGDKTYADTFCFGGKKFDALLRGLGATRIGDIMLHDASSGTLPEELAVPWTVSWIEQVRASERAGK